MSGIVAVLNTDGAPIDDELLARMTRSLAFRGPDRQGVRAMRHVGFGHAWLNTSGATADPQPLTLDSRQWIVADARVDAREDLVEALAADTGDEVRTDAPDAELILRAYRAWGEACVARLLGDFAFAIWDEPERRLFCARDQLGVKPLFYAPLARTLIVSNTLDCIRVHPAVSRDLNDAAIADFLLFGANQEPDTSTFQDIRRLPAAHTLTSSNATSTVRRYWTLPVDEPIQFRRAGDYLDRFQELLRGAVRDRLRTSRVGVLMSGGLDSPTLAAVAASVLRERSSDCRVQAITSVYDRLVPDAERHYAGMIAEHLRIPIRYDVRDDETSILDWDRVTIHTPEPVANPPGAAAAVAFFERTGADARVLLYGEGPDNALRYEWRAYLAHLLARRGAVSVARTLARELVAHPRVPLWSSIRPVARAVGEGYRWRTEFPAWIDDGFSARCACRERWDAQRRPLHAVHPVRPVGYRGFDAIRWQPLFEDCDVSGAFGRCEIRHPFLDLRLLRYMLALPVMPWCRNKLIIRESMRAALPREVLRRRKAAVRVSPDFARVRASGLPRITPSPDLLKYVNPCKIPSAPAREAELRAALRPLGLNYWLRDLSTHTSGDAR
jgi:asparagine synthase (glutamine-hydrolysing)